MRGMRGTSGRGVFGLGAAALALVLGCQVPEEEGAGGGGGGGEPSAEVMVALTTVPTGVQCVRVSATIGTTTTTAPLIAVTAGNGSTSLSLGRLPAGSATFNGAAFNLACASVTNSTTADWIADPA